MKIITGKKSIAAIIITALIFTVSASWAWDFSSRSAKKLKAIDADEQ